MLISAAKPAALERALDLVDHPLHRLGLVDEPVRAEPKGLDAAVVAAGAGVDDDRHLRAFLLQRPQHLEAVHARHLEIQHDAIHRGSAEHRQRLLPAGRRDDLVPHATQVVGVLLGQGRHVVHHEDQGHVAGTSTVARVPLPGSVSMRMAPPRSRIRPRTMESPSPVPPALVV